LEAQQSYQKAVATFGVPAGTILGAVFAGLAIGRSIVAVNKINATKFFHGGFTGSGFGAPDESGSRPAGVVHAGEYVSPAWQVNHPETGPVVRWLNDRRLRGYATGGFVAPNTTPNSSIPVASSSSTQIQGLDQFVQAVAMFNETARNFPTEVKSRVVYTEIETAGTELNSVRSDAAL
jgi:tubulin-specific chaperone A